MITRALSAMIFCLAACSCATTLRVRIDAPVGATLAITSRSALFSDDPDTVNLSIPFVAEFDSGGGSVGYPVTLFLPANVADGLGGRGDVQLYGQLYVYSPTRVSGLTGVVALTIPTERLTALLHGDAAVIETFVVDPNEGPDRYLVRLVLRASAS